MSAPSRIVSLMVISDKQLFVLTRDIDTYVYMLFLRNLIYFMLILCLINCSVLLPLYETGNIA